MNFFFRRFPVLRELGIQSVASFQEARNVLRDGQYDPKTTSKKEFDRAVDGMKAFIYGGTPFKDCWLRTVQIMSAFPDHRKSVLVVFDGIASYSAIDLLSSALKSADITAMCCYIAKESSVENLTFFSRTKTYWEPEAINFFHLSSQVPIASIPATVLTRRGWNFEIEHDYVRLFVHANHPSDLSDACKFLQELTHCEDTLHCLLDRVSLNTCVSINEQNFKTMNQVDEPDCFIYAAATAIYMVHRAIENREDGYSDLSPILLKLRSNFQTRGKDDRLKVLREAAQMYRLQAADIRNFNDLTPDYLQQVVIGFFVLSDNQMKHFKSYFKLFPKNTLDDLPYDRQPRTKGHAVVLASHGENYLRFINSWGTEWADGGFFKIKDASVLGMSFTRIYFDSTDLLAGETTSDARETARKLIQLKGFQNSTHMCTNCNRGSNVSQYTWNNRHEAVCPRCKRNFPLNEPGTTLQLYKYIQSLSE